MTARWTERDRQAWARLAKAAKAVADRPDRQTTELARAVKVAGKAVPPTGDDLGRGHCILLWKFARAFLACDAQLRAENAAKMGEHADLAMGWIKPPHVIERTLRPRADIDG